MGSTPQARWLPEGSERKILFIDDDSMSRSTIGSYLQECGYQVVLSSSGEEGLDLFGQKDPDLVLLDLRMKGMDGLEVLRRIRERDADVPVVVVSGLGEMEDVIQAMRAGANNYVVKSLESMELLVNSVEKAFKEKRLLEERQKYQEMLEKALEENERYRTQLETIFDSLPDGLMTVNESFEVVEFNRSMESLCPLGKEIQVGQKIENIGRFDQEYCLRILEQTLQKNKPFYNRRVECPLQHPSHKVMLVTTSPLRDQKGSLVGGTIVINDISRQEELEEQFQSRRKFENLVGKSQSMQRVYNLVKQLANVDSTVLITGESGTGKELVVEALHHIGHRSAGPLYKVNCSAMSEELLDSELFGHVRGSFTGAYKDKMGRFEAAQGGTLFLDEIGEISHRIQLKLLRVLENKQFERVGSNQTIKADVRIVSATNVDLLQKVREGSFRDDLYYRLKVMNVHLPPLRERKEDIPLLVDHFCFHYSREFSKKITGVTDRVMSLFMHHDWPGNIRELKHAIEHGCLLCPGGNINIDHLPTELLESHEVSLDNLYPSSEELTLEHIEKALREAKGNKSRAAFLLGIHRKTLYRKMHRLGMGLK